MTKNVANIYLKQSICLIAGMTLLFLLYMNIWGDNNLMAVPVCVTALFQLLACTTYGIVWKRVCVSSPNSLPVFYMAASGIRIFAGLVTVLVYCFIVRERSAILFFVITFLIYYLIILIFDTWYFIKFEKKLKK